MGDFNNISGAKAVKIFLQFGYSVSRQKGSHIILSHNSKPTLSIPNHKELSPHLLKSQIRKSGIDFTDFLKLK
jgi:predicted RNA binding protein YcfA (HicA-like mRNA interferase family)